MLHISKADNVTTMALAWHLTNDSRYADWGCRLVRPWFTNNQTFMEPKLPDAASLLDWKDAYFLLDAVDPRFGACFRLCATKCYSPTRPSYNLIFMLWSRVIVGNTLVQYWALRSNAPLTRRFCVRVSPADVTLIGT
jgi:hypothetical protein